MLIFNQPKGHTKGQKMFFCHNLRVDKMNGIRHDGMEMDKNGQTWRKQKKLGTKDENGWKLLKIYENRQKLMKMDRSG